MEVFLYGYGKQEYNNIVAYSWYIDYDLSSTPAPEPNWINIDPTHIVNSLISHTYSQPGSYVAAFQVKDNNGYTPIAFKSIDVYEHTPTPYPTETYTPTETHTTMPNPTSTFTPIPTSTNIPPNVLFTPHPIEGPPGMTVTFYGVGDDPDGIITNYRWQFDVGVESIPIPVNTQSIVASCYHSYSDPGEYVAGFSVEDNCSATAKEKKIIRIWTLTPTDTPTVTPTPTPVVIVIDPGHGGSDPGTRVIINGIPYPVYERDLVMDVANVAKSVLENGPTPAPTVILTREDNSKNPELDERAKVALKHNADFFVSIHFDAQAGSNYTKSFVRRYWGFLKSKSINCTPCSTPVPTSTFINGTPGPTFSPTPPVQCLVSFLPTMFTVAPTCIPQSMCGRDEIGEHVSSAVSIDLSADNYAGEKVLRWNVRRAVLLEVQPLDHTDALIYATPDAKSTRVQEVGEAIAEAIQTALPKFQSVPTIPTPIEDWYKKVSIPDCLCTCTPEPTPGYDTSCLPCN